MFLFSVIGLVEWQACKSAWPTFARMSQQTLVIDPGHGGEDGGAVAPNGQIESQINLAIALELEQLMGFYGVPTVMTFQFTTQRHEPFERKKHRICIIASI